MAWDQITALADKRYVDARRFLPVATGTHFNGNGGAASTSLIQTRCRQTRKLLRVQAGGADQLQLEWANIYTTNTVQAADASCELNGPNAVTVRMAVEYPAGNMRIVSGSAAYQAGTAYALRDQVNHAGGSWVNIQAGTGQTPADGSAYWRRVRRYLVRWDGDDGAGTRVFAPGDYRKSVPLDLLERTQAGDLIAVLGAFDSGGSSNYIPYAGANGASNTAPFVDWVVDAAGGMPAAGASLADTGVTTQTNGTTTPVNSTSLTAWMKIPYATAVCGNDPDDRCVALFGDSIVQGAGGDFRDGEPAGILVRGMEAVRWWRIAQGGNQAGCYTESNAPWQYSCVARCTATIVSLAINDIQNANTVAVVKARMLRMWRALAATGTAVFTGYLTPISSSTDAWATLANQGQWATGGAGAFPSNDATYLTSVYGQIAMWLSQDGAEDTVDGATQRVGQRHHPVRGLLDWRLLLADPITSWKWGPGYTIDGAHTNAVGAVVQGSYLTPQLEPVLSSKPSPTAPAYSTMGDAPVENFPRSMVDVRSTVATGSAMTLVGVSTGRLLYGIRMLAGTTTQKTWTILAGADAAKLKVIGSGTVTAGGADTIVTPSLPAALWLPAGYVVAIVVTTPAASAWGGYNALVATLNRNGINYGLAGSSADTVALTGVHTLYAGSKFALTTFRAWAEMF